MNWQDIETAPKGGGAKSTTDPKWLDPPKILLKFGSGELSVGKWDWYYAEDGNGFQGCSAWVEPVSGELLAMYYDEPIGWLQIS